MFFCLYLIVIVITFLLFQDDGTVEYYNTIVVQPHRKLVTSQGKGFHVRCKYTTREKIVTNDINVKYVYKSYLKKKSSLLGII